MSPGDIAMLNDPYAGARICRTSRWCFRSYVAEGKRGAGVAARPDFYVASRAHHADVGGTYPGSMGLCREIYQEGVRIPPVKIARRGEIDRNIMSLLLVQRAHAGGTRRRLDVRRLAPAVLGDSD